MDIDDEDIEALEMVDYDDDGAEAPLLYFSDDDDDDPDDDDPDPAGDHEDESDQPQHIYRTHHPSISGKYLCTYLKFAT